MHVICNRHPRTVAVRSQGRQLIIARNKPIPFDEGATSALELDHTPPLPRGRQQVSHERAENVGPAQDV